MCGQAGQFAACPETDLGHPSGEPEAGQMDIFLYKAEGELIAERAEQSDEPSYLPDLAAG